jgi:hypothetical protein
MARREAEARREVQALGRIWLSPEMARQGHGGETLTIRPCARGHAGIRTVTGNGGIRRFPAVSHRPSETLGTRPGDAWETALPWP